MPSRPRRGALGLRGRIVGAVIVTTVATLAVAALALLGPLEHSLRQEARKTLVLDVGRAGAKASFKRLDLSYVPTATTDPEFKKGKTAAAHGSSPEQRNSATGSGRRSPCSGTRP